MFSHESCCIVEFPIILQNAMLLCVYPEASLSIVVVKEKIKGFWTFSYDSITMMEEVM